MRRAPYGTTERQLCVTVECLRDDLRERAALRPSDPAREPSHEGEFEVLVDPVWRMPVARMLRRPGRDSYQTILFWKQLLEALAVTLADASLAPDVGILFDYRDQNCVDDDRSHWYDAIWLESMADRGSRIAGRQRGHWGMLLPSDTDPAHPLGQSPMAHVHTLTFRVFVDEDKARRWVARDEFPESASTSADPQDGT